MNMDKNLDTRKMYNLLFIYREEWQPKSIAINHKKDHIVIKL